MLTTATKLSNSWKLESILSRHPFGGGGARDGIKPLEKKGNTEMSNEAIPNRFAPYRWVITKDRIDDGRDNGLQGPRNLDRSIEDNPQRFSMWDDDGECYYEGIIFGDYDGFEPLNQFGTPNAGCTGIKYDGKWL